jgi:hypothetical protein
MSVAEETLVPGSSAEDWLDFEVVDVTGTHRARASGVQRSLPVSVVAKTLAAELGLPQNTPWSLNDSRGAILVDEQPIGEQLSPGEELTLAPKSHLG